MIIGISKKRLREWKRIAVQKGLDGLKSMEMLDLLITECTDLDPWLPIDENAPKDRPLQLFYPQGVSSDRNVLIGYVFEHNGMPTKERPTHYKELPEDREE